MRKFTLGWNATKNTDYIDKGFKQTLRRIKFRIKYLGDTYVYLSQERSEGIQNFVVFGIL